MESVAGSRACSAVLQEGRKGRAVCRHAGATASLKLTTWNRLRESLSHPSMFHQLCRISPRGTACSHPCRHSCPCTGAVWPSTVWQWEIQGDRSSLAFPCFPSPAINIHAVRLWMIRALIGEVTFFSVWQYWCLLFVFRSSVFYAIYYFFHVDDTQE